MMDPLWGLNRDFFLNCLRKDREDEFVKRKRGPASARLSPRVEMIDKTKDFDVYLGESVLPLLAQALEALTKKIQDIQAEKKGRTKDRFHPLSWLGQYIIRQHPRHVRSPRRRTMYDKFYAWANVERGRREILRRKTEIYRVFQGFVYNRRLQRADYHRLFDALDERFRFHGELKNSPHLDLKIFEHHVGPSCDFDLFWGWFVRWILRHDVVKFSVLAQGENEVNAAIQAKLKEENDRRRREEAKRLHEEEEATWLENMRQNVENIRNDRELQKLMNDRDMMLTGVEGGKPQKDEILPRGEHVFLVVNMLSLLGFPVSETPDDEVDVRLWDNDSALAWEAWQEYSGFDLVDGVVEQESLTQMLMTCEDRDKAANLRRVAIAIYDARAANKKILLEEMEAEERAATKEANAKPSLLKLSDKYGFTMARLEWLHETFEHILGKKDDYPKNPSPLDKRKMCELMASIKPDMTRQEFDEYFTQIDTDGSGEIEFDEFVEWICVEEQSGNAISCDEVESTQKPSFEKLAARFDVPVERIHEIHGLFAAHFVNGMEDGYPDDPLSLTKEQVRTLVDGLGDEVTDETFDEQFGWIDFDGSGSIEFDEFLDFLTFNAIKGSGP